MSRHHDWLVLLLGGVSGTGKTTVAAEVGLRLGVPWMQVDDLRLALQRSQVILPKRTEALYFFADIEEKLHVWQHEPDILRDALIAIGDVLSPALEAIIENHLDQRHPIVIEGDGILPSLLSRPAFQQRAHDRRIRAVFLVERDEEALFSNMLARGRGIAYMNEAELRREAQAKWLFGQWLIDEADRYHLPVLEPRPWDTLADRVIAQIDEQLAPDSA